MINLTKQQLQDSLVIVQQDFDRAANSLASLRAQVDSAEEIVIPDPEPGENRIWLCDFETGDFSKINEVGAIVFQNAARAKASITAEKAHSGKYSLALTINTPTDGSTAAYAFVWEDFIPDEAIFRAWYYIPGTVRPGAWWNIEQWKNSPPGQDSSQSVPMYSIGINSAGKFYLTWRPDLVSKKSYPSAMIAPRDQWVLIETYYKKATDASGKIVVKINGTQVWSVEGNPTAVSDQKLYWSVNNYSDQINPDPCTIFVDDMEILAA